MSETDIQASSKDAEEMLVDATPCHEKSSTESQNESSDKNLDNDEEDSSVVCATVVEESTQERKSDDTNNSSSMKKRKLDCLEKDTGIPSVKDLGIPFRAIKRIMKIDPDISTIQNEAAIATTFALELFIKKIVNESYMNAKRRGANTVK